MHVVQFYKSVAHTILQDQPHIEYYGSYHDDRLVAVIELFPDTPHNAGVYNVCTLAEYRGMGIATNLMKWCLQHLKSKGYKTASLQAADDGLNIYKRLGFKEATRFYESNLFDLQIGRTSFQVDLCCYPIRPYPGSCRLLM